MKTALDEDEFALRVCEVAELSGTQFGLEKRIVTGGLEP